MRCAPSGLENGGEAPQGDTRNFLCVNDKNWWSKNVHAQPRPPQADDGGAQLSMWLAGSIDGSGAKKTGGNCAKRMRVCKGAARDDVCFNSGRTR
jgi:hypothetical protein